MATYTSRLVATKPASGENVNITTLNDNFDLFDQGVGATVGASSAMPASAFSGRLWYDTTTSRLKINTAASASTAATWTTPFDTGIVDVRDRGLTTAASSQSTVWNALVATATSAAPLHFHFPAGTWRFDSVWPTIDPEKVRISGEGANHTIIDFSNLSSGPAVPIAKATGSNRQTVPISDMRFAGPSASATTVDCFSLGGSATYANQFEFHRIHVDDFRDQVITGSNTWNLEFLNTTLRNAHRYSWNSTGSPTNAGEGFRFIGGAMFGASTDCVTLSSGGELECIGTSLDYANHLATVTSGSRLSLTDCHFECGDSQTGTEMLTLTKGTSFNSHLKIKGGTLFPAYTASGTITSFIRINGTGGATNDQSVVAIDGLSIFQSVTASTRNALVVDASVASSAAAANSESHIIVNGISYRDAGGTLGSYYPWYVQDRAARKHYVNAGIDYGDLIYDYVHRASAWSFPAIHVLESVPSRLAVDTLTLVSGDLYVVRLPMTAGDGWKASATELFLAIAAVASTPTTQAVGLYTYGQESVPGTTLTRQFNTTGMNFTANANSIHTTSPGAFSAIYPREQWFAAILYVGTTGPGMYGLKAAAQSPLMDPQQSRLTFSVGKLTGQTSLPSSITVSTLVKSDFLPYMAFRPTTYS